MGPVSLSQFSGAALFAPVPKLMSSLRHRVGLATPAARMVQSGGTEYSAQRFFVASEVTVARETPLSLGASAHEECDVSTLVTEGDLEN